MIVLIARQFHIRSRLLSPYFLTPIFSRQLEVICKEENSDLMRWFCEGKPVRLFLSPHHHHHRLRHGQSLHHSLTHRFFPPFTATAAAGAREVRLRPVDEGAFGLRVFPQQALVAQAWRRKPMIDCDMM